MRVEQEQRLTEDARRFAEQDAAAQRHAANLLEVPIFRLGKMNIMSIKILPFLDVLLSYMSNYA